ncbi:MAG: dTDP-4-amino-4,6-dideoxygalactose transaminase [Planctomycetia bacterium]|nr:dTDP-4-amino-4,6-dideoxygalactose transaminase [Planctomycetia bacterium]
MIPFHRIGQTSEELRCLADALESGLESDGRFTIACARLLEQRYRIQRVLPTPSCTAALEIAAILCNLTVDDEVIMPSFTFTSTANAVVLRGAKPIFVDVRSDTLNLDERLLEAAVTVRTKAIFVVHYAGVACEMDVVCRVADRHNLIVVEDAAQAVNASYRGRSLGSIGQLGTYSFHATKNYVSGEGGALCINDERFIARSEIIREKGTNRTQFMRGETQKYEWVDFGGSHLPSELTCAFLYAQLQKLDAIQTRRREIYDFYYRALQPLADTEHFGLPHVPDHCESNCHLFYLMLSDAATRDRLRGHMAARGIGTASHYVPLHTSPMGRRLGYRPGTLPITESIHERILRLPLYPSLTASELAVIVEEIRDFF